MMRKAPTTGADSVVFDLEDAVSPGRKDEAREAVGNALGENDPDCEVLVRVTPDEWEKDLDRVLEGSPNLDGIMLPKVDSAADIDALATDLDERGERGVRGVDVPVIALIESACGVLNAAEIADTHPVDALCFGAEDLTADLGAERTSEGTEVLYAREKVVLAAASVGIDAIDTVFTEISETNRLREETEFARGLGYDGKIAIHPAQVPVINEAFTPSTDRVEWAERVLNAREAAERESKGVFRVDDEMVDAPLIAQAERIVTLARAAEGENRPENEQE